MERKYLTNSKLKPRSFIGEGLQTIHFSSISHSFGGELFVAQILLVKRLFHCQAIGGCQRKQKKRVLLTEIANKELGTYKRQLNFNLQGEAKAEKWKPTKGITCPFCGKTYSKKEFQALTLSQGLGDELLCVRSAYGVSKNYILPEPIENFYPSSEELSEHILQDLKQINQGLPDCRLPCWSGIVNPTVYGARTYVDLFNKRQLSVLLKVIRSLRELTNELGESGFSKTETLSIVSMLSAFVDQLVDWNCRLSMWIEENQQIGRALSGPGIPMLWRYAEIDPFQLGPANLHDKLDRMVNALRFVPRFTSPPAAHLGSATKLPFEKEFFDAIITDPAYGDNLFYAPLSQCIYVWKRMILRDLLPDIFSESCVPLEDEIVAPIYKLPFIEAMNVYEQGLTMALQEASRVLKPDGALSLFFAHGTEEAWELIIRAFRNAGFRIVTFWPILLERHARPRGINSSAVNVSVVIVGRHACGENESRTWPEVEREINPLVSSFSQSLKTQKWKDEDIALACFIKAVGVIARFDEIVDGDEKISLKGSINRCARLIEKSLPSLSLKTRSNKTFMREDTKNVHAHLFEPSHVPSKIEEAGRKTRERKRPLEEHYETWEKRLAWVDDNTRDIVKELTTRIQTLGDVTTKVHGRHFSFNKGEPHSESRFAVLRLSKKHVSVRIRAEPTTFKDSKKWAGDKIYTKWFFHHGRGQEREFRIAEKEQINYATELIKHSYEISGKRELQKGIDV